MEIDDNAKYKALLTTTLNLTRSTLDKKNNAIDI